MICTTALWQELQLCTCHNNQQTLCATQIYIQSTSLHDKEGKKKEQPTLLSVTMGAFVLKDSLGAPL